MTRSTLLRPLRLGAVVALLALMTPQAAAIAADEVVTIGAQLSPKTLTVTPGTNVAWQNNDDERHRIRSESGPEEFDSGNLETGQSFTFNFAIEGVYTYIDDRDEDNTAYHGTITVAAEVPPPSDPGDPPPPPPASGDISIVDRSFQPSSLTVGTGATVTWANNDGDEHTVTATDSSWDSGIFGGGATFSRTFQTAGSYAYFCIIHPDMTGTITVLGDGGEPAPPPPSPPPTPPDPSPPPPPAPPAAGDVNIFDFGFTPGVLTVGTGSTVTWSNTGVAPHTVTDSAGTFDSGFLFAADAYSRTFATPGTYNYFCTLHPQMTATVVVEGAGGDPVGPGIPAPLDPDPPPVTSPSPAPFVGGDVSIVDNAFTPRTKSVTTGTTVVWANNGLVPHTVTSSSGGFDSGFLFSGDTYRRTFSNPGTYDYLCTIHPGMTGTIQVTGAPTGDPSQDDGEANVDPLPDSGSTAGPSSVSIVDNAFQPATLTVSAGSTVTWANTGALPHTVTSAAGGFDSGILAPGAGFSFRPVTPGTYSYLCTLHPEMTAILIVTEATEPIQEGEPGDVSEGIDVAEDGGASTATQDGEAALVSRTVQMVDNAFQPLAVKVSAGEAVRWRNDGAIPHTATAAGVFDSRFVNPGEDFVQVFDEVGVYEYICTIHPEMVGTVDVVAAAPTAAAGVGAFGAPAEPVSPAIAFILAGSIVVAVGVMAFGMARFARAAGEMR